MATATLPGIIRSSAKVIMVTSSSTTSAWTTLRMRRLPTVLLPGTPPGVPGVTRHSRSAADDPVGHRPAVTSRSTSSPG